MESCLQSAAALVEPDGSEAVFAKLSGDGKLAIGLDGNLVRMICNPTAVSTFEAWELDERPGPRQSLQPSSYLDNRALRDSVRDSHRSSGIRPAAACP